MNNQELLTYRIIIEPDDRGTFHGYVPALSGCHTWGKTIEETREHLREALSLYVMSLVEDGEDVPRDCGYEMVETVFIPEQKRDYGA